MNSSISLFQFKYFFLFLRSFTPDTLKQYRTQLLSEERAGSIPADSNLKADEDLISLYTCMVM